MKILLPQRPRAFTVIDVLVVLAILTLLAIVILPNLAPRRPKSRQVICVSNLKQVGLAWFTWVHDHESEDLPYRIGITDGGTLGSSDSLRNYAWWQYSMISNELNDPKVLVCPLDRGVGAKRRVARNWSATDQAGGFRSAGFRDRATSYTIGLDARESGGGGHGGPSAAVLASDRNIRFDGRDTSCSATVGEAELIKVIGKNGQNPPATAPWTNTIHGLRGNVLSLDGGVQQTTTKEFHALCDLSDDNGSIHFLVPK